MTRHLVAAVQMTSGADKSQNVTTASRLVRQAAERGAVLIALPELFNCLGPHDTIVSQAEELPGPTSEAMSELAAECRVTLVAGSIGERSQENGKIYNTSLLFGPDGTLLAKYRKLHLFDIDLPGFVTFRESHFMSVGERPVVTETRIGRLGQAICYDLRFPELFRLLIDLEADCFVIPSAFTMVTGRDHWQVLLQARAIENQVFVIAPNQYGRHSPKLETYGRSLILDPWGTVLATAPDGEGFIMAEIDFDNLDRIRRQLPSLQHRRDLE
jgi:deaminated glutathione amidase